MLAHSPRSALVVFTYVVFAPAAVFAPRLKLLCVERSNAHRGGAFARGLQSLRTP
jgi:hypothetical protein